MGKEQSPFMEELKKAEEAAQIKGVGLWNKVGAVEVCFVTTDLVLHLSVF